MGTKIDITDENYDFLVEFKKKKGLSEDSKAIESILNEYKKMKNEENIELNMPYIVSEKSLADAWNSEEDEKAFTYLQ